MSRLRTAFPKAAGLLWRRAVNSKAAREKGGLPAAYNSADAEWAFPHTFPQEETATMVATASRMVRLGTMAPDFSLPDSSGRTVALRISRTPPLLVIFLCNHCPYVKHVADSLAALVREYQERGVAVVGINANDFERYPDDAPPRMAEEVQRRGYTFPYSDRRDAGGGPGLPGGLHARLLRFRQGSPPGLSRADGLEPAGQQHTGHGRGLAEGPGRGALRQPGLEAAAAQPGLQHQVEAGQRAGLIHLASWRRPGGLIEVNSDGQGAVQKPKAHARASRWAGAREPLRRLASAVGGDGQFTPTITLECRKYAKNLERREAKRLQFWWQWLNWDLCGPWQGVALRSAPLVLDKKRQRSVHLAVLLAVQAVSRSRFGFSPGNRAVRSRRYWREGEQKAI